MGKGLTLEEKLHPRYMVIREQSQDDFQKSLNQYANLGYYVIFSGRDVMWWAIMEKKVRSGT